jgi:magnesium chelatase subunit I
VIENVMSNAERRAIVNREKLAVARVTDLYAALPSITGKIELEYEGELQGAQTIANDLVRRSCLATFEARAGGADCDAIVTWFDEGGAIKVGADERSDTCVRGFAGVPGLLDVIQQTGLAGKNDPARMVAACELVLEGLVAQKRISRTEDFGYIRARRERGSGGGYGQGGSGGQSLFQ